MFNKFLFQRIEFRSNPPLPDKPMVVADQTPNGSPMNKVVYKPNSNKSYFDGVTFDSGTMSLRAKINLGLPLTKVPNVSIENDPTILNRRALSVEQQIESRLNELSSEDLDPDPNVSSVNPE